MKKIGLFGLMVAAAAAVGCDDGGGGDAAGKGSVSFNTWGEEYIEDKIPAAELEDGWEVTFDKLLINLGHVQVADAEGTSGAKMEGTIIFNHKLKGVKEVFKAEDLEAKAWEKVSYEAPIADKSAELSDGVTEEDKALLVDNNASVYVKGSATKGADTKTFTWIFSIGTSYADCKGEVDGKETDGALVTNGGQDDIQLTIHGDHFFYDDLQSANAVLRFDAIAAADNPPDGDVTLEELSQVKLVDIPEGSYGTGSVSDVNDLGAFVIALSQTLGHFRGEGECFATKL